MNKNEVTSLEKLSRSIVFAESLLKKIVNEKNLETEHLVVISLYRKLLEQLDGNYVLADHNLDSASKVMIRASYETYLALSYILKEKRRIRDRAYSYYIGYVKSQQETANYILVKSIGEMPRGKLEATIQKASEILETPKYSKVVKEWERTKVLNKGYEPKWYSLFNGPKSVKKLVERLNEADAYKLYGLLSTEAHGYQALNGLYSDEDSLFLKPVRNEKGDFQEEIARSLCTSATFKIIRNLFPKYENLFINFSKEIGLIPPVPFKVNL